MTATTKVANEYGCSACYSPNVPESILQTTAAVERWDCDVGQYDKRFGKTLDEDVKIGVILALAPLQVLWTGGSSSCQCTTTL